MVESSRPRRYVLFILCLIFFIEGTAYFAGTYLCKKGRLYRNSVTENYGAYFSRRDPLLGWVAAKPAASSADQVGPGGEGPKPCLSLYGAAFFVNQWVDPDYGCDQVLAKLLNCKVANYGVGGYGTDQAYLTFHNNKQDKAKVVLLGFSSDHIRWNVNRLRNLISPLPELALKPRFIINSKDELQLIPIPDVTEKSFYQISAQPEKYLDQDYFLPGGLSGVQTFRFPYTICLLRVIKPIFQRLAEKKYPYDEFYQPQHPAQALRLTAAIMALFSQEAKAQGKHPCIVLIPLLHDLWEFQEKGTWIYQPLIDQLEKKKVPYFNAGPKIIESLGNRRPSQIFQEHGFLNNDGQKLLGSILYNYVSLPGNISGYNFNGRRP